MNVRYNSSLISKIFSMDLRTLSDNNFLVSGWVRSIRISKVGLSFLIIYDGSSPTDLQVILKSEKLSDYEDLLNITPGCSVEIKGKLISSKGSDQDREILADSVNVLGLVESPDTYPISKKKHSLEHLRSFSHLRIRTKTFQCIAHIRNILFSGIHEYFQNDDYLWIATPILTSTDCEGAGEAFEVHTGNTENSRTGFFNKLVSLTVSGQLHGEAYACALSKIYTFGPTFRAENSNTSRHLAEFWMVEPEVAFCDLSGIINVAKNMIRYISNKLLKEGFAWLELLEKLNPEVKIIEQLKNIIELEYNIITYTEAIKILQKSKIDFVFDVNWGIDLKTEHERYLAEVYFNGPVFITNYPSDIKAFYMKENIDEKTVAAFDLLLPNIGEIIGGSEREERIDVLDKKIKNLGLDIENLNWYIDLRRYGSVKHSGFGLGFERFVSYVSGISNIRDVIPFPRSAGLINH